MCLPTFLPEELCVSLPRPGVGAGVMLGDGHMACGLELRGSRGGRVAAGVGWAACSGAALARARRLSTLPPKAAGWGAGGEDDASVLCNHHPPCRQARPRQWRPRRCLQRLRWVAGGQPQLLEAKVGAGSYLAALLFSSTAIRGTQQTSVAQASWTSWRCWVLGNACAGRHRRRTAAGAMDLYKRQPPSVKPRSPLSPETRPPLLVMVRSGRGLGAKRPRG